MVCDLTDRAHAQEEGQATGVGRCQVEFALAQAGGEARLCARRPHLCLGAGAGTVGVSDLPGYYPVDVYSSAETSGSRLFRNSLGIVTAHLADSSYM